MRFIYEHAGCVVAPSRGEGFGLPVAEAMLLGCPVIATPHGGHADICVPGSFWPIEFKIERAKTHLTEQHSYWAEPSLESMRQQMRAVFTSSEGERRKRTGIAKAHVAEKFTWSAVARRHADACSGLLEEKRLRVEPTLHIGFISTWNTRCGIAEYTRYLASNLNAGVQVSVFADEAEPVRTDERNVIRCWKQSQDEIVSERAMRDVVRNALAARPDLVSLQFNFGFFPPNTFGTLIEALKAARIAVFVTMHSTQHSNLERMISMLSKADLCIVHREEDLDRLMQAGVQNTVIQRQGILSPIDSKAPRNTLAVYEPFIVACFGFFLPPKGIHELLQAFELASGTNGRLRLKLLNALYPNDESRAYAAACMQFLEAAGLADRVEIWTEFLPEEEILDELSTADLIVLPYTHSTESSSAAIRLPLASLAPVLCSDLAIFDEFQNVVHRYPAGDTIALANKILKLGEDREQRLKFEVNQRKHVENLSWRNIGKDFLNLAQAYVNAVRTEETVNNISSATLSMSETID
jgi:glycosyltransferase involved in cell wall biosynthesis